MSDSNLPSDGDATGEYEESISLETLMRPDFIETKLGSLEKLADFLRGLNLYNRGTPNIHEAQRVLFTIGEAVYCLRVLERFSSYEIIPYKKGEGQVRMGFSPTEIHALHAMRADFPSTVVSPKAEEFLAKHPDPGDKVSQILDGIVERDQYTKAIRQILRTRKNPPEDTNV